MPLAALSAGPETLLRAVGCIIRWHGDAYPCVWATAHEKCRSKVIPEKEHPIKNLIRKQKIESTKGTKSTNKSMSCSCLSCFSWTMLLVGSLLEIT